MSMGKGMGRGVGWFALPLGILAGACSQSSRSDAIDALTVVASGATNPTVALDPRSGDAYVAWVGTDGGVHNVYVARAEAGAAAFSEPVRANDIPGDAAPHDQAPAQIAVGPGGEVYVLWQNNRPVEGRRFPASDLRLAVSSDGGRSFAPAITVNDDAGGPPSSHTFHDLVVADDGTVFVSWIDSRELDRERAASGAMSDHAGHAGHAGMESEGDEAALEGPDIRIASSSDGGRSFGSSMIVDTDACPCCRTAVALGPDGSVWVAWRKIFPGNVRDIVVARSTPGTMRFEDPVRVAADGWVYPGCPHAGPSIAFDDEGRLHVAWYTGQPDRQGLWYAVSDAGGVTFSDPVPILSGDWVPPSRAVLAPTGTDLLVAWEDRTAEPISTRFATASAVSAGRTGSISHAAGRLPAIDAEAGHALASWLDGEAVRAAWIER